MNNGHKVHNTYTVVGTNIEEVKRQNASSGMSYNEVKALLVQQRRNKEQPNIIE
ncbi:hypothetical protein [Bacillus tuaregi]|uniref:hypothetical protein n=1 Tax=Bacillus tuaregi TaxID=1816695 RepID=UPI000A83C2F4|nr:hypothetical protein [Bacillus tuaregi]